MNRSRVLASGLVSAMVLTALSMVPARADATSLTITPATQTVQLGTAMTPTSVTATPGPVINQIPALRTVRTLAGPSGASVTPTNVTTTELDGIRGVVQESGGDFYGLLGTTSLVRIARATGAVTTLTYTPGASITGQGLGIDSSDRLYVQQGNKVVQLSVSGTTVTETGGVADFTADGTPTAFQVTGSGRVYGLFNGGVITTADISSGNTSVAATGYLTNSDWGGTAASWVNSGPTGLHVQESVAGNPANAQVYVVNNWGAVVLQVEVISGAAQASGAQKVSPISDITSAINTTTYSPTTMDGAGNLYWMYQNCVRMLPAGTTPRESVAQVGQISSGLCEMVSSTGSITTTAGYVDGTVGTSRINAGWVSGDAVSPPAAHGGLVIDIKGTNPTGRLMIADTNNDALRSMDRVGWGVTPELYNGLTLNTDGSISGTPTGTSGLNSSNNVKTYTLSYSNADGSVVTQNTTITLTAAPSSFTYQFPGVFSGNNSWFAISDNVGGQIWGTIGTGEFTINQAIVEACPSTLGTGQASTRTSLTCGTSDLITNASLGIPTATTWSISPALPTGVTFDTSTGGISGTPTVYSPVQTYTVTAANSAGSATATFSFGVPQPATVTFDANGGSGSMSAQTSVGAANLNNNTFTPPAGQIFNGWNTQANGGGTNYSDGASYPFSSSETLYAQWAVGYVIQYDPGTGASGSIADSGPYLAGTPGSASGLYFNFTAPAGTQFNGWNTRADGTGDFYWFGASLIASSDVTLYAQWINTASAASATYTYQYDQNGGTWSGTPTPTVADSANSWMPLSAADPSLARPGWSANGWNTKPDGSGAFIAFADYFSGAYANLTMYANWYAQVTYDANDPNATGSAPVDSTQYASVQTVTVEGANTLAVTGFALDSWNTQANGSGTSYAPGDTLTLAATGDLTLYAQWVTAAPTIGTQPSSASASAGSTATFSVSATASAGSLSYQWEVRVPGGSWVNVSGGSGATTATYTTPTLSTSNNQNEYRVVVTDTNNSTTSSAATLTVTGGGGGGGGGGGSSTPTTPTTPTAAPSTPAAVLPTSPVAVPPSVTSGSAAVVVGGQTVTPTVTPVNLSGGSVGNAVSVAGPGFQSTLSGPSVGGSVPSGSVTVVPGQPVQTSTSGFAPGASVQVWLVPSGPSANPASLGTLTANASGLVNANVSLPAGTAGGPAAIQINGAFASGGLLSVSVGVTVAGGVAPVPYSSGVLPQVTRGKPIAINPTTGEPVPVDSRITKSGAVQATNGVSSLVVQTTTSTGSTVPANAQGSIVVEDSQLLRVRGSNLAPNSELAIWVFSDPVLVGVVFTDAKGSYRASLPVPAGLPVGKHTLQTNGTSRSGERLSVSLGLVKLAATANAKKTTKASVYFDRLSTKLDARDKVILSKLVKSVKGTPIRTIVVGYVQDSGTSANNSSLSRARAMSVAAYLRKLGLSGQIVTKSGGVKSGSSSQARRVNVAITYQA